MPPFINRVGQKFSKLTVLHRAELKESRTLWVCQCECGKVKTILGASLVNGHTKSCGCLMTLKNNPLRITHGDYKTKLYSVWRSMKQRCTNPEDKNYKNYGGRGIYLCEEWKTFKAFKIWALSSGYANKLTIDRTDNDKGYFPDNCTWVPQKEQLYNTRSNVKILLHGIYYKINELSKLSGLPEKIIRDRLHAKWSVDKVLNTAYKPKLK